MEFNRPNAKQESQLVELLLSFKNDPYGFVMAAFPWEEAGTPLANFKGPREWQVEELLRLRRAMRDATFAHENGLPFDVYRAAFSSGRGPGKSAFLGMLAVWFLTTHPGASVIIAANTETQLRTKILPEIAKWFTMTLNRHWFSIEGLAIRVAPWLAQTMADQLKIDPKFYGVFGQMWQEESPDSFTGGRSAYGNMVLFDEAAGIPNAIWDIVGGFFMSPARPAHQIFIATSQMRRPSGRFYDLFYDPAFADWHTRTMDTRDPKYGIPPEIVAREIAEHGGDEDCDYVRVDIRGLPPKQGDRQLITTDDVRGAQERELLRDENAPLIMGCDPAPRGRTVIRFRRGRDARSIPPFVLDGYDNVRIADFVVQLMDKYNPDAIAIDMGMGTGVIDILRKMRVKVTEVSFGSSAEGDGEFALFGAQLWGRMRDWMAGGMIDKSDTLFRDLTKREWRWHGREESKKALEPKASAKARGIPSPDDGDALAITFAVNPPRRDRTARGGERVVIADHDEGYDSLFRV